jgi:ankyrin repeat protein
MNYMNILVLSVLCATSFLSHCMEKPNQEAIAAANNKLWKAAVEDNIAEVEQIITEGVADVNSADIQGNTALMYAAWNNNANIVNALIKAGADVNSVNKYGNTALMRAAMHNHIDIVNALIKAGADINTVNKYGDTALMYAGCTNKIDIVNALINVGADINTVNKDGYTAFMLALHQRKFNASILLIKPSQKSFARKKLETLIAIHNKNCSYFSLLPKEVLKIIITCMHPEEFAMDHELMRSLNPQALVDNIPLENLALLVKDGTINQDTILAAWQKKINGITESLTKKKLDDNKIQEFATEALAKITMLLTQ